QGVSARTHGPKRTHADVQPVSWRSLLCKRQVASGWRKWCGIGNVQIICYARVGAALAIYAFERVLIRVCEIRDTAREHHRKVRHVISWCACSGQIKTVRPAGAAADYNDFAVAAWIVPVINNGVPHIICLLGIISVVVDVVLPWKGMRRTVHFKVRRRQAIFNRYTHESILRNVLSNIGPHSPPRKATSVNHNRYAMPSAIVDVVHGRSN